MARGTTAYFIDHVAETTAVGIPKSTTQAETTAVGKKLTPTPKIYIYFFYDAPRRYFDQPQDIYLFISVLSIIIVIERMRRHRSDGFNRSGSSRRWALSPWRVVQKMPHFSTYPCTEPLAWS